jgi:DNA-binding NarL/FixJ family response regulator
VTRFIVLEDQPPDALDDVVREVRGTAQVVRGWRRPAAGGDTLCVGTVANTDDAAAAVLCAVSGARLVVSAVAERDVTDRLVDDLRRLGDLDHRIGRGEPSVLGPDEQQLLALLLGGATLGKAASALHISRRTADRRLANARAALGARSTSEAVAAAARAGVRPRQAD